MKNYGNMQSLPVPPISHDDINLKAQTTQTYRDEETPRLPRHDSLVFSITAEKCISPYESDLLKESAHKAEGNSDISLMDMDCNLLPEQMHIMKTHQTSAAVNLSQLAGSRSQLPPRERLQLTVLQFATRQRSSSKDKQNHIPNSIEPAVVNNHDKVGCFHRKNPVKVQSGDMYPRTNALVQPKHKRWVQAESRYAKNHSFESRDSSNYYLSKANATSKQKNTPVSTCSKKGTTYCSTPNNGDSWLHDLSARKKQVTRLRNELLRSKLHAEKSERSRSLCAERFSQTKRSLSKFKKLARDHEKVASRLSRELKKGDNIRMKQKETIRKQKEEIRELRKVIAQLQKLQTT